MNWMRRLCFMVLQVERVVMCSNGGLNFEQISKLSFANFVLGTSKGGLLESGHVYDAGAPLKPLFISADLRTSSCYMPFCLSLYFLFTAFAGVIFSAIYNADHSCKLELEPLLYLRMKETRASQSVNLE